MADQAALRDRPDAGTNGVIGSLSGLGNDVATLAELQAKLAALDFKESTEKAALPFAMAVGGIALLTAGLPVLLIGIATVIAQTWNLSQGWALILVAVVALAIAAAIVIVAGSQLTRSFASFRRSREELTRNLSWLRTVLVYSGRSVPPHRSR